MTKEQMEYIALVMMTSPSLTDAAQKVEICVSTLYKLRQRKDFQKVAIATKNQIFGDAMMKAQAYTLETLEVLRGIMLDRKATDSSRVAAGRTILEVGLNAYDTEQILARIEKLEGTINAH